ncbi:caspase family protein [Parabacteroides sp. OttesenSCG-928-J18]|nr:caspase family protein [Parabacteroides sp. OttesenSCG-928-J18]
MKLKVFFVFLSLVLGVSFGQAKNHALLIGIGNYNSSATGWTVIHGNNDIAMLEIKIKTQGFTVSKLADSQATKANIIHALNHLLSSTSSGDVVYLHFSGHGQLIEDMNNDERENLDQSFICYDACFSPNYKSEGTFYRGQNHLIDDELFPYLNQLKRKVGINGSVIVVFDTCYSGGADRGEMADDPDPDSEVEWDNTTRGSADEFQVNQNTASYLRSIVKPDIYAADGGTITVISACESDKKNYECKERHSGRKYGSLSYCIGKLMDKDIPMSQWGDFFNTGEYKVLKIFRPSQHPVVEIHQ